MDVPGKEQRSQPAEFIPNPALEVEPTVEFQTEKPSTQASTTETTSASPAMPAVVAPPVLAPSQKTVLEQEIESILEEDIGDIFWTLPESEQQAFKQRGEETASKIRQLLSSAAVKAQEIFRLIATWLKTIPGVNSFFIEQEAKIKTDKILKLKG